MYFDSVKNLYSVCARVFAWATAGLLSGQLATLPAPSPELAAWSQVIGDWGSGGCFLIAAITALVTLWKMHRDSRQNINNKQKDSQ